MAYCFLIHEPVSAGVKRIVGEQIDQAIGELKDDGISPYETVHQVRKRYKKIRAVLRLARTGIGKGTYRFENTWFRDVARTLSHLRDADVLIETYDKLMEHFSDRIERRVFGPIRRKLTVRRQRIEEDPSGVESPLVVFLRHIREARERVDTWSIDAEGSNAIGDGLKRTYRRGRGAMSKAYDHPSPERFHEWRKRVKYHGYHCRLLREIWEPVMKARQREVETLSDWLGHSHDLAVLQQTLIGHPDEFGNIRELQTFIGLIEQRRAALQAVAEPLGERVFAEKPKPWTNRVLRYWEIGRAFAKADVL